MYLPSNKPLVTIRKQSSGWEEVPSGEPITLKHICEPALAVSLPLNGSWQVVLARISAVNWAMYYLATVLAPEMTVRRYKHVPVSADT